MSGIDFAGIVGRSAGAFQNVAVDGNDAGGARQGADLSELLGASDFGSLIQG